MVVVPDICGLARDRALRLLQQKGLLGLPEGNGSRVCHQQPEAGILMACGETVLMSLCPPSATKPTGPVMPSVVGLTIREAVWRLHQRGIHVKINGSGVVARQVPRAGNRTEADAFCQLECKSTGDGRDLMTVASGNTGNISLP
jgi:beta-lactam-binding protein with PASTA domain